MKLTVTNDKNLHLLRRGESDAGNLFLIHDRSGDVAGYIEFCRHLSVPFNCWGIQSDRLENFTPVELTIAGIAGDYLRKIKQVQPQGPYIFAAWSFGGEVAFELARLLEQNGENIRFLAFIDAPGPQDGGRTDVPPFSLGTEMALVKKYFRGMGLEKTLSAIRDLNDFWPTVIAELESKRFPPEYLRRIVVDYDRNAVPFSPGLSISSLVHYWNINRSFRSARHRYIPSGKLETVLHYFEAVQSKAIAKGSWDDFCTRPVVVHDVPGNHHTIFRQPLVRQFASMFCREIG